jgi:hypothetical protein
MDIKSFITLGAGLKIIRRIFYLCAARKQRMLTGQVRLGPVIRPAALVSLDMLTKCLSFNCFLNNRRGFFFHLINKKNIEKSARSFCQLAISPMRMVH